MVLKTMLDDVSHFHQAIGASIAQCPTLLPCEKTACTRVAQSLREVCSLCQKDRKTGEDILARVAMAVEELAEWVEAHAAGDLVAAADAWGDRLYVLLGDAVATGLPASNIFAEVHRSNMTKATADHSGKARKGTGFKRPRLVEIIQQANPRDPADNAGTRT